VKKEIDKRENVVKTRYQNRRKEKVTKKGNQESNQTTLLPAFHEDSGREEG
jgi:hypothetical protein